MANFWDLPNELCYRITHNLSKRDLFILKSLNSFFLDVWMAFIWKEVGVDLWRDEAKAERLLQRMVDPFVVSRVKVLRITSVEPQPSSFAGLLSTLPLLTAVRKLEIGDIETHQGQFTALIQAISSSPMASTLRQLNLRGREETLALLEALGPFKNLEELSLELNAANRDPTAGDSLLLKPFLLGLSSTLQLLQIETNFVVLSPLFNALSASPIQFQNLKSVSLFLPSSESFADLQADALHRFLLPYYDTLKELKLWFPQRRTTEDWLAEVVKCKPRLSSLRTLSIIPPTFSKETCVDALIALIPHLKLSTLLVLSCTLPDKVATKLIKVLATTNLGYLEMGVTSLSVSFLDLLASKLPQLDKLNLNISVLVGSEEYSFAELLHQRKYNPSISTSTQDVLHAWKLRSLDISVVTRQPVTEGTRPGRPERAVAVAVPSLVDYYRC